MQQHSRRALNGSTRAWNRKAIWTNQRSVDNDNNLPRTQPNSLSNFYTILCKNKKQGVGVGGGKETPLTIFDIYIYIYLNNENGNKLIVEKMTYTSPRFPSFNVEDYSKRKDQVMSSTFTFIFSIVFSLQLFKKKKKKKRGWVGGGREEGETESCGFNEI